MGKRAPHLSGKNARRFALLLVLAAASGQAQITLNPEGYFEGPGFNFLVYHNTYVGGRQGGLQMLLHGTRVLHAGCLFARKTTGEHFGYYGNNEKEIGDRAVDLDKALARVPGKFLALDMTYALEATTDGQSITITVRLDEPVDWDTVEELSLNVEISPEPYFNKTYTGGGISDYFLERHMGRKVLIPEADEIVVAPEEPHQSLTFRAENAVLSLRDERRDHRVAGYMVLTSLPPGSQDTQFAVTITPKLDAAWRRTPVIQVSQAGYHPEQRKVAVLELDRRTEEIHSARLLHLDETGAIKTVKAAVPEKWGPLFDYEYFTFDFTDIAAPGQYFLAYGDAQAGPFRIDPNVYENAWHPTMDTFFPAQMCHVKVRDYLIVWHGACHVDDALQAPLNKTVIDGYRQGPETETRFAPNEHVPGLDWGGWHDAGDFDLASGAVAGTAMWLALAQEEFGTERDVTSVSRSRRHVELYEPDGRNDMLQQTAFGMEYLLGLYRALGHIGAGVIANNGPDYGRVGDPTSITDGLVYDPDLAPGEVKDGRSGTFDDRWVFTNRNTGGQYQFAQVAAIASRVLRGHDDALAADALLKKAK
jgi:endoglucanase